jgi:hypothetical protein
VKSNSLLLFHVCQRWEGQTFCLTHPIRNVKVKKKLETGKRGDLLLLLLLLLLAVVVEKG